MNEICHNYFLLNGNILTCEKFKALDTAAYPSVYEVIRVLSDVPLFLEEHLKRLKKSVELLGFFFPFGENEIKNQIHRLIEINSCKNNNLKIVINHLGNCTPNLYIYFIPSFYPAQKEYVAGVSTILYSAQREYPNVKVVTPILQNKIEQTIKETGVFEALLINKHNEITEGSRSNTFFVKKDTLYTAPPGDVLLGITRKRIIALCQKMNIPILETPIMVDFLDKTDGLFLTGTSIKVLPISSVDYKQYPSSKNKLVNQIMKAYNELIEAYISDYATKRA